jgi:hypothetical protein
MLKTLATKGDIDDTTYVWCPNQTQWELVNNALPNLLAGFDESSITESIQKRIYAAKVPAPNFDLVQIALNTVATEGKDLPRDDLLHLVSNAVSSKRSVLSSENISLGRLENDRRAFFQRQKEALEENPSLHTLISQQKYIYSSGKTQIFFELCCISLEEILISMRAKPDQQLPMELLSSPITNRGSSKELSFITSAINSDETFLSYFSSVEAIAEETARGLTFRYEEQIQQLNANGVLQLSISAVRRMGNALVSIEMDPNTDLPIFLIDSVLILDMTETRVETEDKDKEWTDSGIFQKPGIKVYDFNTGTYEYWIGDELHPGVYGYRLDTMSYVSRHRLSKIDPCDAFDESNAPRSVPKLKANDHNSSTATQNRCRIISEDRWSAGEEISPESQSLYISKGFLRQNTNSSQLSSGPFVDEINAGVRECQGIMDVSQEMDQKETFQMKRLNLLHGRSLGAISSSGNFSNEDLSPMDRLVEIRRLLMTWSEDQKRWIDRFKDIALL